MKRNNGLNIDTVAVKLHDRVMRKNKRAPWVYRPSATHINVIILDYSYPRERDLKVRFDGIWSIKLSGVIVKRVPDDVA